MNHSKIDKLASFYKNKIKDETNIEINLTLKPIEEKNIHDYYSRLIETAKNINEKSISSNSKIIEFELKQQISKISYPIFNLTNEIKSISNSGFFEFNQDQNPTFYYSNIFLKNTDRIIVNNLCKSLWCKLRKNNLGKKISLAEKEWMEGFSCYGENIYFNFIRNIYGEKSFTPEDSVRLKTGMKKMKSFLDKYGIDSYLEIPTSWILI